MAKLDTLRLIADKCKESAQVELDNNKAEIVNTLDSILGADNYTYNIDVDMYRFSVDVKSGKYECSVYAPWHWHDEDFTLDIGCPSYSNKTPSKEYAEMYYAAYLLVDQEEMLREVVKSLSWDDYKAYDYARSEVEREERRIRDEEEMAIVDEIKKRIQVGATFHNIGKGDWSFDTITKVTDKSVLTVDEYGDAHRMKFNDVVFKLLGYACSVYDKQRANPVEFVQVRYRMWDKSEEDGRYNANWVESEPIDINTWTSREWMPDGYDADTMGVDFCWTWARPCYKVEEPTFDPLEGVE